MNFKKLDERQLFFKISKIENVVNLNVYILDCYKYFMYWKMKGNYLKNFECFYKCFLKVDILILDLKIDLNMFNCFVFLIFFYGYEVEEIKNGNIVKCYVL